MFSQLFGKYLVERKALSDDTLKNILKEQEGARVRLGTIAVADGLLTEAQADEINYLQTQMDKRFGDIAVEQKYLTENQVSTLLKKQGNSTMKFYQLLTDMAGLSLSKIDEHINKWIEKVLIRDFKEVQVCLSKQEWKKYFPAEWMEE